MTITNRHTSHRPFYLWLILVTWNYVDNTRPAYFVKSESSNNNVFVPNKWQNQANDLVRQRSTHFDSSSLPSRHSSARRLFETEDLGSDDDDDGIVLHDDSRSRYNELEDNETIIKPRFDPNQFRTHGNQNEPIVFSNHPNDAKWIRHPFDPSNPRQQNSLAKKFRKTGTTIVGCVAQNGTAVVIAADTRSTSGSVVADKRCEKIHELSSNVWCAGAGTSGDIDALVRRIRYGFLVKGRLKGAIGNIPTSGTADYLYPPATVEAVCHSIREELYGASGQMGANLILAGYEHSTQRAVLRAIHPHGSMDYVPYAALGSGGLAAMSTLEVAYPGETISLDSATELCVRAVTAGITEDLGSGSCIDVCVIDARGLVTYRRTVVEEEELVVSHDDEVSERNLFEKHTAIEEEQNEEPKNEISDISRTRINGVNGFGSLPYVIKSKRYIVQDEDVWEDERRSWIENELGL